MAEGSRPGLPGLGLGEGCLQWVVAQVRAWVIPDSGPQGRGALAWCPESRTESRDRSEAARVCTGWGRR